MDLFDFEEGREGYYGAYGGTFLPEILHATIEQLKTAFRDAKSDPAFWQEFVELMHTYSGRPTPVTHLCNLSNQRGGAQIYVTREDLNHTGSHKINNVMGQGLLVRRMGKKRIIAEGQYFRHQISAGHCFSSFPLQSRIFAELMTRFKRISHITPEIEAMAGDAGTGLSKGGMKTKLIAAKTATAAGCAMAIAAGQGARPIKALYDGARATWFDAVGDPATARKRWISSMKAQGSLQVDDGAARALMRGTSLLPAGVIKATGTFERGDLVEIKGADGHKIGQGLCRFSQDEAQKIQGCQSQMIETILGYPGRSVMIHRDDMVLG